MGLELRELAYFAAVVDEGSISTAAEKLMIAQPPLSRAIRSLERRIGTPLLERHARGVRPTAAGEYLAEAAHRLLHDAAETERQVRDLGAGRAGRLRVTAIPALVWDYLPQAMAALGKTTPGIDLHLAAMSPSEILTALSAHTADLGLVACRDDARLGSPYLDELVLEEVGRLPLKLALPARLAHLPDPVGIASLAHEPWIVPSPSPHLPSLHELVVALWHRHGLHPPERREVSNMQVGIPLIAAGMGVGIVPVTWHNTWQNSHPERSILLRDLTPHVPSMSIVAVQRRRGSHEALARSFLATLGTPRGSDYPSGNRMSS